MSTVRATEFEQWTNRYKVYVDYIKALGQYKKDLADAEIKNAEADQQREKVKVMQAVKKRLDNDMKGLAREENKARKETARLKKKAKEAARLLRGQRLQALSTAWRAYGWFQLQAMKESPNKLYELQVTEAARDNSNFFYNKDRTKECDSLPTTVTSVVQMAAWLREKGYLPKMGEAHRLFAMLYNSIDEVAGSANDAYLQRVQEMKDKTYEAWQPVMLIGGPSSSTGKKIEEAGPKET